ncbi:MAG TPA: sugar ABC transporter ATP-binding protein [Verrucomicrobiae bacterium]
MSRATSESQPSMPLLLRMTGICKNFGNTTVLKEIQLELQSGEVHVLAGENGAGKSTLIKILAGIHTDFEGNIQVNGRDVRPKNPLDANSLGIAVIHQELSLIDSLSVADNIFLGRTPARHGFVLDAVQQKQAAQCVQQLGLDIDTRRQVGEFTIAVRQLIEIAKALSQNAKIIVMDEPTSALNAPEVERLFALIQTLKARGCGIIYITHKMEEIARIADRITVLRDGKWIGMAPASELPIPKLIQWMIGREVAESSHNEAPDFGKERLRVENFGVFPEGLSKKPAVENISFSVRSGEILGIAGLQGSGATELFHGIFGDFGSRTGGEIYLDGAGVSLTSPRKAIEAGVALLTNDRKATGLVLSLSIVANATLAGLRELSPLGWRRPGRETAAAEKITSSMKLRAASMDLEVGFLSGGNQQKVAIAKWLQIRPRLLLLDEPTRGIDIGAKQEIYQLMREWAAQGIAILLITSEMPELLTLSDRILVMHRGHCTAQFSRQDARPENILAAAMGTNIPNRQN